MEAKHTRACKITIYLCLTALLVALYSAISVFAAEASTVFYEGVTTNTVNVREGAGTDNPQIEYNGIPVKLGVGVDVIILSEQTVGSKVWYEINFVWEGADLTGFATSSYILKSDVTVTLTPTPTPSPTITPSPEPTPTPTAEPTDAAATNTPMPPMNGESGDFNSVWAVIIAIVVICVIAIVVIYIKNKIAFGNSKNSEMLQKVKNLKNISLKEGREGKEPKAAKEQVIARKRPEVRVVNDEDSEEDALENAEFEDVFNDQVPTAEGIKASATKESEEKKALRARIDGLKQHDIVVHKYFGKGEVYDNSDVKLLEVRFASDVRFLNKDSLVAKRLLVFDDDRKPLRRN